MPDIQVPPRPSTTRYPALMPSEWDSAARMICDVFEHPQGTFARERARVECVRELDKLAKKANNEND